jgi:hypothetical protein
MYLPVVLRNKKGGVVEKFDVNGAMHLEDVTLFIWRDMMLCILAYGTARHKSMIPVMLDDIEGIMGWKALVQLLYNKPKGSFMHPSSS